MLIDALICVILTDLVATVGTYQLQSYVDEQSRSYCNAASPRRSRYVLIKRITGEFDLPTEFYYLLLYESQLGLHESHLVSFSQISEKRVNFKSSIYPTIIAPSSIEKKNSNSSLVNNNFQETMY